MPYTYDRICFICGRENKDRNDFDSMVQLIAPDGDTVDVCKKHKGVEIEHAEQEGPRAKDYALKALNHPTMRREMAKILSELNSREMAMIFKNS